MENTKNKLILRRHQTNPGLVVWLAIRPKVRDFGLWFEHHTSRSPKSWVFGLSPDQSPNQSTRGSDNRGLDGRRPDIVPGYNFRLVFGRPKSNPKAKAQSMPTQQLSSAQPNHTPGWREPADRLVCCTGTVFCCARTLSCSALRSYAKESHA